MQETKTANLNNAFRGGEPCPDESTLQPSQIGLVGAMAKLLSSQQLRDRFEQSPEFVADHLNVLKSDVKAFVALCPDQLRRQANTLLNKRWHEVQRLVPLTIESLGDEARDTFRFFATNDWPTGHRRHPIDALRFLQFLVANRISEPNKMEWKRMRRINSAA